MRSEKLNRMFSSKVFYIVFSVLVSVALWMYVEINDSRDQDHTVRNIPIVFRNEDVFRDRSLVIDSVNPATVSLTFKCRKADVARLTSATVSVTVDLSEVTAEGLTWLPYTTNLPSGVSVNQSDITGRSVERISLTADRLDHKSVTVKGVYTGGAAAGFIVEPPEFSPETIMIEGPREVLSKIDSAWVTIMRENLSATYVDELEFILLDEFDEELEDMRDKLSFSHETVRVTVPVNVVKDVTLDVNLVHGAGASNSNTMVTITPAKITISGDPSVINDISNTITLGTIDLTRFDLTTTETFTIALPNNVKNESGEQAAEVLVEVRGLSIGYFSVTNINTMNTPKGYVPTIINQSIVVRLRGTSAQLEAITPLNIRVVADLTDYSPGSSRVLAKVYVDGAVGDVGAIGDYWLTVRLDPAET